MRDVTPLKRRMDTPESREFWANIEKTSKEIESCSEWKRGKCLEPIPRYGLNSDKLVVKHKGLRTKIASLLAKYNELTAKASKIYEQHKDLLIQMQSKCEHEYVLERKTSWRDEYDSWHDGYPERKCVDCFFEEKSDHDGYKKLINSTVIELIMNQEEKVFSLEFEDLKP